MDVNRELADLLMPDVDCDIQKWELLYPDRRLDKDSCVTRFAPSPTGFLHIGGVYTALVSKRIANQSNGVFILRIEDTDKKREVKNGVLQLIDQLKEFNITFDEGMKTGHECNGDYGPYIQSARKGIYHTFVKFLIVKGLAYPCFCLPDELEQLRKRQESAKEKTGYYGSYAIHRNASIEEVRNNLSQGKEYVIRFKNHPEAEKHFYDLIKGDITLNEDIDDIVLLKTDGMPTYHLAHVADDYLMRVTHVLRADEWLSSLPIHLKLFGALNLKPPRYGHISPILKSEGSSKRKLSKRKDPEASIGFYRAEGYPADAVLEYLLNIANSDFEKWRSEHPLEHHESFILNVDKMKSSGALFDLTKLKNISKEYISKMGNPGFYEEILKWARVYDAEFAGIIAKHRELTLEVLAIGRDNAQKQRKDYAKYSDLKNQISYFYDDFFENETYQFPDQFDSGMIAGILSDYGSTLRAYGTNEEWFDDVKKLAVRHSFAANMPEYKKNKAAYKGSVSDVSLFLRMSITKRTNSFDLFEVIKILGVDKSKDRIKAAVKHLTTVMPDSL